VEYIEKAGDECGTYRSSHARKITEKRAKKEKTKSEEKGFFDGFWKE
jgi:hypothetical protein